ncbi:hypothetical protein PsorP6_009499 [Peronosclerospora sorghi]|uniref:Uncharacterized protein n=1 Tax=Peronosclerospora sorghi TaxID=230839 RepID=A0ACC0VZJ6_9STRA|nr:hypothetical protein PsorP6_009499 [Peronosclerospora sorghi]
MVAEFISEECTVPVRSVLEKAFEGVETANFEFPLITKAGRRVEILLNATPRYNEHGEVKGMASKIETLMQQQVQDALLAHSAQRATNHKLDPDWRFAGSLGKLKAFKSRGLESFNSSSSWPTIPDPAACCTPHERSLSLTSTTTTIGGWSTRSCSTDPAGLSSSYLRTIEAPGLDPLEASPGLQSYRIFGRI